MNQKITSACTRDDKRNFIQVRALIYKSRFVHTQYVLKPLKKKKEIGTCYQYWFNKRNRCCGCNQILNKYRNDKCDNTLPNLIGKTFLKPRSTHIQDLDVWEIIAWGTDCYTRKNYDGKSKNFPTSAWDVKHELKWIYNHTTCWTSIFVRRWQPSLCWQQFKKKKKKSFTLLFL